MMGEAVAYIAQLALFGVLLDRVEGILFPVDPLKAVQVQRQELLTRFPILRWSIEALQRSC